MFLFFCKVFFRKIFFYSGGLLTLSLLNPCRPPGSKKFNFFSFFSLLFYFLLKQMSTCSSFCLIRKYFFLEISLSYFFSEIYFATSSLYPLRMLLIKKYISLLRRLWGSRPWFTTRPDGLGSRLMIENLFMRSLSQLFGGSRPRIVYFIFFKCRCAPPEEEEDNSE